jgi:hypothetical protein
MMMTRRSKMRTMSCVLLRIEHKRERERDNEQCCSQIAGDRQHHIPHPTDTRPFPLDLLAPGCIFSTMTNDDRVLLCQEAITLPQCTSIATTATSCSSRLQEHPWNCESFAPTVRPGRAGSNLGPRICQI